MKVNLIVAQCRGGGIGLCNELPWVFKKDMKYFRKLTIGKGNNAVVMGRKTWDSLPRPPLKDRKNYVLSKKWTKGVYRPDINTVIDECKEKKYDELFVIGGQQIYEYALNNNIIDTIYNTIIHQEFECDTYIDPFPSHYKMIQSIKKEENNTIMAFETYVRT